MNLDKYRKHWSSKLWYFANQSSISVNAQNEHIHFFFFYNDSFFTCNATAEFLRSLVTPSGVVLSISDHKRNLKPTDSDKNWHAILKKKKKNNKKGNFIIQIAKLFK